MSNDHDFPVKANGPRETPDGNPVIWSNPDVPHIDTLLSDLENGSVSFECPYPNPCDQIDISVSSSADDVREAFEEAIEGCNGTFRCEDCNEPLYGFYGNGDSDGE